MSDHQKLNTGSDSILGTEENEDTYQDINQSVEDDKDLLPESKGDKDHIGDKSEENTELISYDSDENDKHVFPQEDLNAEKETLLSALSSWLRSPLDYEGRTARKPFWLVIGFLTIIHAVVLTPLIYYSTIPSPGPNFDRTMLVLWAMFFLARFVMHFFTLPMIVRRIRDIGVSPYLTFVIVIPVMGILALLAMSIFPSDLQQNASGDMLEEAQE